MTGASPRRAGDKTATGDDRSERPDSRHSAHARQTLDVGPLRPSAPSPETSPERHPAADHSHARFGLGRHPADPPDGMRGTVGTDTAGGVVGTDDL